MANTPENTTELDAFMANLESIAEYRGETHFSLDFLRLMHREAKKKRVDINAAIVDVSKGGHQ